MTELGSKISGAKPCPFCGSEDIEYSPVDKFGESGVAACCMGCSVTTGIWETRKQCKENWNGRTNN